MNVAVVDQPAFLVAIGGSAAGEGAPALMMLRRSL
jgi:hypothetical protein